MDNYISPEFFEEEPDPLYEYNKKHRISPEEEVLRRPLYATRLLITEVILQCLRKREEALSNATIKD